jgi:acetyl esterase/lipase
MRLLLALTLFTALSTAQQPSGWPPSPSHPVVTLWPAAAPDATPSAGPEADLHTGSLIAGKPIITLGNVSIPTMTLYKPTAAANGAAVIVFPGGGYSILAIDLEGTEVCDWLTARGTTCLLLKYRVPNSGPYPKSPQALEDAQRAISSARQHAAEWGFDPHKVGVLGFSAGGHLAAALSTHFDQRLYPASDAADQQPMRPDFAIVIYPGYLADERKNMEFSADVPVTAQTPPTFLLQAENDPVHVENTTDYFLALKRARVPAEVHIYAEGGHGYGLRRTELPITKWPDLVDTWLQTIHMTN